MLIGWAHCEAGIERVELSVNDAYRVPLEHGRYRLDIAKALGAEDAGLGFGAHVDLSRMGKPPYLLGVEARTADGRVARVTGEVDSSAHGAYRAWRELDERERGEREKERAGRFLGRSLGELRLADGSDLSDALRNLAARGEGHLVVADPAGEMSEDALRQIGHVFAAREAPDALYADEDAVVEDGGRGADFLKPGWSPELLLATDYVGPLLAVGPRAAEAALGAGEGPITTIYDLALRLLDAGLTVERIPEVLFTRAEPRERRAARPEVAAAERAAAEAAIARRGRAAEVEDAGPGRRRTLWRPDPAKVSVVIPSAFSRGLLEGCLRSLREHAGDAELEVIVVDSSGGEIEGRPELLEGLDARLVAYEGEGPFNYSRACDQGAAAASGDFILFLNDDTEALADGWLERMLGLAQLDGVGIVGAKLLYPDGSVQHAGVNVDLGAAAAAHLFALYPRDAEGYRGLAAVTREVSAVTGACLLIDAKLFAELDGFDETFALELGDIDLCLRAGLAGARVVWTPDAELVHHEAATRGHAVHSNIEDVGRFATRWRERFADGDPLYHPAFQTYPSYQYRTGPSRPDPEGTAAEPVKAKGRRDSPERYIPEDEGRGRLIEAEHEGRYRWAAALAAGRDVLDAGCGAGYGTGILAAAGARSVTGVDVSPEAVVAARGRAGEGPRFFTGDLQELPFEDDSFDLVTCFEAIEHVPDPERVIDELRRVLRPDGLLAISTPNRGVYLPGNPWHVHEYTAGEFERTLKRRFPSVRLYRQQARLATEILDDASYAAGRPEETLGGSVRRVIAGVPGSETYTLALAGSGELPALAPEIVLASEFDLTARVHDRDRWRTRALDLQRSLGVLKGPLAWRAIAVARFVKRRLAEALRRARNRP